MQSEEINSSRFLVMSRIFEYLGKEDLRKCALACKYFFFVIHELKHLNIKRLFMGMNKKFFHLLSCHTGFVNLLNFKKKRLISSILVGAISSEIPVVILIDPSLFSDYSKIIYLMKYRLAFKDIKIITEQNQISKELISKNYKLIVSDNHLLTNIIYKAGTIYTPIMTITHTKSFHLENSVVVFSKSFYEKFIYSE